MTSVNSSKTPPTTVHFITGATSLLGSEYLFNVLASSMYVRCSLLIHAKSLTNAEIRVNSLLQYLYGAGEMARQMRSRIDIYFGDIRKKQFGLSNDKVDALTNSVNYIFHAASNSNLSDSEAALNHTNVTGTISVLSFAKRCTKLERLMHVSSAYVSGSKKGVLAPDELNMKQAASDYFQLSKRVAEKLVRKQVSNLPIVIIRPSTIVGNSMNGRASSFKAFYYPTRQAISGRQVFFPVSRNGKVEAIPSDWAAKMALKLMFKEGIEGRSFHITMGERAYTMEQIKRIIEKNLDREGAKYRPAKLVPRAVYRFFIAPIVSLLYKHGRLMNRDFTLLSHYSCIDRVFDNTDTFRATGVDRHTLPDLDGYYKNIVRYANNKGWR